MRGAGRRDGVSKRVFECSVCVNQNHFETSILVLHSLFFTNATFRPSHDDCHCVLFLPAFWKLTRAHCLDYIHSTTYVQYGNIRLT